MTVWVYVGRMDDPGFRWDVEEAPADPVSNLPRPITDKFPRSGARSETQELWRRIHDGTYEGRRTDWGGFVARVTRAQILQFMDDCYGRDPAFARGSPFPELLEQYLRARAQVEGLDSAGQYALVWAEQ